MRALTPRSRLHGERGASMVLILALITILGLCVGGIAVQGTAGMMAVQGVKNQRNDIYGAEGAIDGAINYIRNDLTRGRFGADNCPSSGTPPTIFSLPSDAGTMNVTCRSLAGSGDEIEGVNYPENAVLTTGGLPGYPVVNNSCNGDPGICLGGSNGGIMTVQGSVKSNATSASGKSIDASSNTKLDAGQDAVRATGTCTGNIIGVPVACGTGITRPDPGGGASSDPAPPSNWAAELQSMPPLAPAPTCNPISKVATMQPGSYFDRDAVLVGFTAMTTVSGKSVRVSCPVVWMKPGNYYFDYSQSTDIDPWRVGFDDASGHLYNENFGSGTDVPGSVIIGGTLSSAINPNASSSQVNAARAAVHLGLTNNNPAVPGGCDRTAPNGVQVMMAHYAAFDVKYQGMLELCPSPSSSKQQIALVGRKTDQAAPATSATFKPTGQVAPITGSGTPFAPGLSAIDGVVNTGNVNGMNKSATVTVNGYSAAGQQPTQTVGQVTVRIAHREVWNPSNSSLTISAQLNTSTGGSCTISGISKSSSLATYTKTLDDSSSPSLADCGVTSQADLVGSSVKWTVTTQNSGSPSSQVDLDGIEMDVAPRALAAKTPGSKIVWLYGDLGAHMPEIYIWGTVYAPTSRIELALYSVATTVARFGRGVVVAGLIVSNLTVNQSYAAFANASGVAHYANRKMELIAWLGGTRQLRVVIELDDTNDPSNPGKTVKIISWTAVN